MSLFDIAKSVVTSMASEGGSFDAAGLGKALEGAGLGGLSGIVSQLQGSGLGDQVASWLGKGANMPVNADQLTAALGGQTLEALAGKFGIPADTIATVLAGVLPQAVDQASPDGVIEDDQA